MSKEQVNILLKSFSQRPIAYQKIYAEITRSVTAGLLLSQIVYWWYAVEQREFYKTDNDWTGELAMGLYELRNAKKRLVSLSLVSIRRKGIPARTHYKLNVSELLRHISSYGKNQQLVVKKSTIKIGSKSKTITKNTIETTTEKNKDFSLTKLSQADVQKRAYLLLTHFRVHPKAANSIIYDKLTPLESVEETIRNGLAKQKYEKGFHLEPGYIVAALNGARKEGKAVTPTKNSKKLKQEISRLTKVKSQKPLSKQEFERKKEHDLKKLLAVS